VDVVLEPVLERRVVSDAAEEIGRLGPDDWLVLTSVYAIEAVAPEPSKVPRVAVVAEASRRAAEARGFRVELIASGGDAKSLFGELRRKVNRGKVCYPRSSLARPPDPWPGIELLSPILYTTGPRDFDREVVNRVDAVSVVSPSAVEAVGPVDLPFASIGPSTSAAIRKLGREPWIEAPQRSFESLAQALAGQADSGHRA
jgi:uroporphyrinogen-III synthase